MLFAIRFRIAAIDDDKCDVLERSKHDMVPRIPAIIDPLFSIRQKCFERRLIYRLSRDRDYNQKRSVSGRNKRLASEGMSLEKSYRFGKIVTPRLNQTDYRSLFTSLAIHRAQRIIAIGPPSVYREAGVASHLNHITVGCECFPGKRLYKNYFLRHRTSELVFSDFPE